MNRDDAVAEVTGAGTPWELQQVVIRGRRRKWFVNGPQTLRDLFEQNLSDNEFFVYEGERFSYRDIWRRASSLAVHLRRDHGLGAGDRVAIAMRNYPEWAIAFTSITSIGAIAVAVNAWWEADELDYALTHTGTSLVIADEERLERLQKIVPRLALPVVSVRSKRTGDAIPIEDLLGDDVAMPPATIDPDVDAVILFTSGSTGPPKGSVSTHRNIISALLSWEVDYVAGSRIRRASGVRSSSPAQRSTHVTLLGMPLFHVNGLLAVLLSAYRTQRIVLAMFKWDPLEAIELIEREGVASVIATPAMTGDLTNKAEELGKRLPSLASVGGGGAARATSQVKGIDRQFSNARPVTGWGMTETNSIGTGIYGDDYLSHPASSGRCSAVLEIGIVDAEDNFLPANERGELVVRGTSVIHGYWNRPDANEESFMDDWFRTGDVAYLDDEGYLYVVDRIKQLIIRGGENIGCGEVESALLEHDDVVEASVYGAPDERLGEEVAATLFVRSTVDSDEITAFLQSRLAQFKIPRYLRITDEPLPRIASGKLDKKVLRAAHLSELAIEAFPRSNAAPEE